MTELFLKPLTDISRSLDSVLTEALLLKGHVFFTYEELSEFTREHCWKIVDDEAESVTFFIDDEELLVIYKDKPEGQCQELEEGLGMCYYKYI